jgi:hypothetical protein
LENQNWFQFCTIWLAFKRGCLEAVLSKNTLNPLGVNTESTIQSTSQLLQLL